MKVLYHKVSGCLGIFMSEIHRIHTEGLLELIFILYPGKIKIYRLVNVRLHVIQKI